MSSCIQNFKSSFVPIDNQEYSSFNALIFDWTFPLETQTEVGKKNKEGINSPLMALNKSDCNVTIRQHKRRLSGWQFIDIPNYDEPILTSAALKDKKLIMRAIKRFESIPQVLKECDTDAQKKYYETLEKINIKASAKTETVKTEQMKNKISYLHHER